MEWSINWRKLCIQKAFTSAMCAGERWAVLIFASFNSNGFIREQAVRMMAEYAGTLYISFCVKMMGFMQVRQAATMILELYYFSWVAGWGLQEVFLE